VFLYSLLMFSKSLRMTKIHWNMSKLWQIVCKNHNFNTSAIVGFTVQNPHKSTWITLRKLNILLFQKSIWAHSSFSQLLDGAYSYVLQFPGHIYKVHYSNTWKSVLYVAHHQGTCAQMWHKSPQPNCVHQVIGYTRNIHLTTQAQHILYPTITQRVIFQGSHPIPQQWHLHLHHKILQTTRALIK